MMKETRVKITLKTESLEMSWDAMEGADHDLLLLHGFKVTQDEAKRLNSAYGEQATITLSFKDPDTLPVVYTGHLAGCENSEFSGRKTYAAKVAGDRPLS